jgi:branched-chain amino acid transport system substrate-binding protein
MKKLRVVTICLFGMVLNFGLTLTTAVCQEPIKIGVIRDLTAAQADAGRSEVDAIKMIFDDINEKGGILGRKIDYMIGDDKSSPDRAASLAKRYIEVDKVLLIHGTTTSAAGLAVMKIAIDEKVPVLGHAYSVKMHEGEFGKWYFASGPNNDGYVNAWLYLAKRDGFKKIGVLWVNYAWGRDAKDNLYKFAKDYGLTIIGDVPVEMGASEATAEVAKMREKNPEAVICPLLEKDGAAAVRGFAALGWNPARYAGGTIIGPIIRMIGPSLVEGWRGQFICDPSDSRIGAVLDKFKARYGYQTPEVTYFVETWDATNVLVHVLKTMIEKGEPLTRINLRDAMEKYSAGVDMLAPQPRKSTGWPKPPHVLTHAEDFLFMMVKDGKIVRY